jgi:acetoacetyl-CoA synthetase
MNPTDRTASTAPYVPQIRLYQDWLQRTRQLQFADYPALWRWSVTDLDAFWQSIWDYFDMQSPTPRSAVLARNVMPGAQWFPGAQANYAQQVFRHVQAADAAGFAAIVCENEAGVVSELSWPELRRQAASLALHLRAQGVQPGDRVAAYLPNCPQAMVAFLATVSLGAVWSICAPDMGTAAVLDRFAQIEPTVLIAVDGVHYAGRAHARVEVVQALMAGLPSVRHLIVHQQWGGADRLPGATLLADTLQRSEAQTADFEPLWLPFDHPLWIVYSSGTTGLPKPIVHGHGGVMLEMLKLHALHLNLHPSTEQQERLLWYCSSGWVMWNLSVSALLLGTTVCIYDGHPSYPQPDTLWRLADEMGLTFMGAGAAYYSACLKAGVHPAGQLALSSLRSLGSTGSPLSPQAYAWGFEAVDPGIWWCVICGGTDLASAFLGGTPELPTVLGQMQSRCLGADVQAWDEAGRALHDEVGELVVVQPMPSMPLYFWGDEDQRRYRDSYFDTYPGVWRQGDWLRITPSGGTVVYGRSDATLNRHGHRLGTSELYRVVEDLPEVVDSLVVDLEYLGRPAWMPLFVMLRPGLTLDDALRTRLIQRIRQDLSPRFLPDEIVQVQDIPRTLTGKKQELPVKKLMLGRLLHEVVNPDACANPEAFAWYAQYAQRRLAADAPAQAG